MLSPVCIPRGSKFSILHTVIQLSYLSLTTSYSTSFQPFSDSSTRICGEYEKALAARCSSSFLLVQNPDPCPPRVYAALIIIGNPSLPVASRASSTVFTARDLGVLTSISLSFFTNNSLSSVSIIALTGVPRTLTEYFSNTPEVKSFVPQLRAVCPPKDNNIPSGFSFFITFSTKCGVTGRKYILSASFSEVCTVAILGFISTVLTPSSLRAFRACEPL